MVYVQGDWAGNGLRFATHEEADTHAYLLSMSWSPVSAFRVDESSDPVNYALVDGRLVPVAETEPTDARRWSVSDKQAPCTRPMSKQCVLVVGNLTDGFRFIGPFADLAEAVEFSESVDTDNWVATLEEPPKAEGRSE